MKLNLFFWVLFFTLSFLTSTLDTSKAYGQSTPVLQKFPEQILKRENKIPRLAIEKLQDSSEVLRIQASAEKYLQQFTEGERKALRCRLSRVAQAQFPVQQAALVSVSATDDQISKYKKYSDSLVRINCGADGSSSLKSADVLKAQLKLIKSVAEDFSADSLLSPAGALGYQTMFDVFNRFGSACFSSGNTADLKSIAQMTDKDFNNRFLGIAFGDCSSSSGALGGAFALPVSGAQAYGQCVHDALRDTANRSLEECGGISGQCGEGQDCEGDTEENSSDSTTEERTADGQRRLDEAAESALAEVDRDQSEGEVNTRLGLVVGFIGTVGAVVCAIAEPCGAVVALGVGGVAVAFGGVLAAVGQAQESRAADRRAEVRGLRVQGANRLCPAVSSPLGPLTFAAQLGGASDASTSPRLTVLDAIQSCRCQYDPLNGILSGGSELSQVGRCEFAERVNCLRQAEVNDTGQINLECRQTLASDNEDRSRDALRRCSVQNCGPAQMIGDDCECHPFGGTVNAQLSERLIENLRLGSKMCRIQCPEGTRLSPIACRCVPDSETIPVLPKIDPDLRKPGQ